MFYENKKQETTEIGITTLYCDYPQSLKLKTASKRRNTFCEDKRQEAAEMEDSVFCIIHNDPLKLENQAQSEICPWNPPHVEPVTLEVLRGCKRVNEPNWFRLIAFVSGGVEVKSHVPDEDINKLRAEDDDQPAMPKLFHELFSEVATMKIHCVCLVALLIGAVVASPVPGGDVNAIQTVLVQLLNPQPVVDKIVSQKEKFGNIGEHPVLKKFQTTFEGISKVFNTAFDVSGFIA
ncbi:hypothetical protein AAG570_003021 [Ranatra chinensis]|uniref:Uncharacterized protein n=1 Tax=Ranatra chinensis TaxID=642074 RepID=A0ABD0Y6P3_9HEMI